LTDTRKTLDSAIDTVRRTVKRTKHVDETPIL
jgi:hypothetical protein